MELRKATMEDWEILLEWRNDLETRRNSHDINLVQEADHKKWLSAVLQDENRELYIWVEDGVPAGTVRADWDEKTRSYELSWTISPDFRGKGIGKKMVKALAEKIQNRLRAEVKAGNTASGKIAEFAGLAFKYEENGILHYANF